MADSYAGGELLAEVVRSDFTEGYHRGSVIVLDPAGEAVARAGDVSEPIFPRSANKPLQATGMLRAGLRLAGPRQLALATASHRGEPVHIETVRAVLAEGGLTEDQLACPPDVPFGHPEAVPSRVQHNCSGKHAAMLRTARAMGAPVEGYRAPDHPVQVAIRAAVEELAGEPVGAVGVDGCGAPVLALSLYGLASAYLRLLDSPVADAARAYPELVSGTGTGEAALMRGIPGALVKGGAEGVLVVAVPDTGVVAVKIDDGGQRAVLPVMISALRQLGRTEPILDELAETPVLGGGEPVGAVRALPW